MAAAAGPDQSAPESIAADQCGQIEEIAADLAARGGGRQKRDVVGQRAEIAGVVGQPLELERQRAQPLRAQRCLDVRPELPCTVA